MTPHAYVQGSKRACEFLKAVRYRPMTREQLRHELGWSARSVRYWCADLLIEGLLVEITPPDDDVVRHGFAPKLVAIAPAWGGQSVVPALSAARASRPAAPAPADEHAAALMRHLDAEIDRMRRALGELARRRAEFAAVVKGARLAPPQSGFGIAAASVRGSTEVDA